MAWTGKTIEWVSGAGGAGSSRPGAGAGAAAAAAAARVRRTVSHWAVSGSTDPVPSGHGVPTADGDGMESGARALARDQGRLERRGLVTRTPGSLRRRSGLRFAEANRSVSPAVEPIQRRAPPPWGASTRLTGRPAWPRRRCGRSLPTSTSRPLRLASTMPKPPGVAGINAITPAAEYASRTSHGWG